MRPDQSPIPEESSHRDPARAVYNSMCLSDALFNHPIKWVFCRILILQMKHNRSLSGREGLVSRLARTVREHGARKQKESMSTSLTSSGSGGASDPGLPAGPRLTPAQRRARTRWHLALVLSRTPELNAMRRRVSANHSAGFSSLAARMKGNVKMGVSKATAAAKGVRDRRRSGSHAAGAAGGGAAESK
mmetsp:Transcript_30862/g.73028  ORF Transcript_30862/g.73028 Transcript_30862/m.73028 type:complete len:189 (-) Transcript_30862:50-616(-)